MALNPFFLQGSQSEQRLIQELVNEQLTIYGVEVIYLPRKIVNKDSILNEIQSSKFDDNFAIEAYVNTYEGYGGAGDIMTKFGVSLKDELTVTISKERFEDFIASFLGELDENEINVHTRPREGDLIYFPLGGRLFEIKFVEHEQPFYQLGKNYVYQLKCELFEYSDELGGWDQLSTTTEEIDSVLQDQGYITSILMIGAGTTATAVPHTGTGYVKKIFLNDDGHSYTSTPNISISNSPDGNILANATAVAITTTSGNVQSVKEILITNAGFGYTEAPTISITGGGGSGAIATCSIETTKIGIVRFDLSPGSGYPIPPTITIGTPTGPGAAATSTVGSGGAITGFTLSTGGEFYGTPPNVTIDGPTSRVGVVSTLQISNSSGNLVSLPYGTGYSDGIYETSGGSGSALKVQVEVNTGTDQIGNTPSIVYSGQGYSVNDVVQIIGGNNDAYVKITAVTTGIGSTATADSILTNGVVTGFTITNPGSGYTTAPTVSIANTVGDKDYTSSSGLTTAIARTNVSEDNRVVSILIENSGAGYDPIKSVTIESPPNTGIGTFIFNELVTGSISGAKARVKTWNQSENILKVGTTDGIFVPGDVIVGSSSSARYSVDIVQSTEFADKYDKGSEIETLADTFLDFTETNPFGTY